MPRGLLLYLFAVGVFLLSASPLRARERVQGWCEQGGNTLTVVGLETTDKAQQSFPGCTVTVWAAGTMNLSTIFSDDVGTAKANPFTADGTTGLWSFYADNARYDIQLSGGGIAAPFTLSDFLLDDSAQTITTIVVVASSATPVFDVGKASILTNILTANVTSSTITNAVTGQVITIYLAQDATGGRTFVWPANVQLRGGGYVVSDDASAVSTIRLYFDGTNWREIGIDSDEVGRVLVPVTTGDDFGSATARWDALLEAVTFYATLLPNVTGLDIGSASARPDGIFDVMTVGQWNDDHIVEGNKFTTIQLALDGGTGRTFVPNTFTGGLAAQLSVASSRSIACPAPGVNEILLAANVDDHAVVNSDTTGGNTNLSFFECSFDFNGANQTTGHGGRWEKVVGMWNVDLRLKDASLHNWNYVATGGGNQETNRAIFHSNIWTTGAGKQATLTGDNLRLGDDSADTFGAGILSEGSSNEGVHLVGNRIHFVNLSDTGAVDAQIRIGGNAGNTTGVTVLGFSTKRGPASAGHSFDILNADASLIIGGYIDHTDHTLAALDGLRWVGSSPSSRTVALGIIVEKARNAFHPETATDTIIGGTQAHTSERNGYLLSSGTTLFGCIGRDGSQEVTTTYDGVNAPAGITDFSVIGCRLYDAQGTATQRFGMRVESGAGDRHIVAFNRFSGNVTSDFSDASTGDEKYIFGNLPRTIGNYIPAATEFSRPSASDTVITAQVDDDTNDRLRIRADGLTTLGDGTSAPDVTAFQRTSANNIRIGDTTDDVVSIRRLGVVNSKEGTNSNVPRWIFKQVDHTDMAAAATADTFTLWTLPVNTMIHDVVGAVVTAWAGTGPVTAAVCSVGTSAGSANDLALDDNFFAVATVYELHDATANGGKGTLLFDTTDKFAPTMFVAGGVVEIQCDLTGGNHSTTSAGQARIYILVSQPLGNTTLEAN